ncbi:hypothetical protein [Dyella tabacisoli]|uniref:Erythromycin esterase family protein n=1 Tax=Dyella tabacisoli TaxID=2282381 RepID=A0A369USM8_9GAMM|nr:hypothetical protein [Dyella tabacisoli]RDD83686.1 hypothetical protein DVJ77_03695 [Dyella tabacisoli]
MTDAIRALPICLVNLGLLLSMSPTALAAQQSAPAAAATTAQAAPSQPSLLQRELLRKLPLLKNDLARYQYLTESIPQLSETDRILAQQLLATVENELGMYNEAIRDFPFDNRVRNGAELPQSAQWQAVDAADAIEKLAANRRLVMINEAHHDAHTRQLTLALLPRLRALGFTHFAIEALDDKDSALMKRGYPVSDSGSEYLHEPIYGDIVREAIKLGFIIVPYESDTISTADRETHQADNLYRRVFMRDPKARLLVHAGYAHIDKVVGSFGSTIQPMAAHLIQISGIDPLSIDQTQLRDVGPVRGDTTYRSLLASFEPKDPTVLLNRTTGNAWSTNPAAHDISVLLPPAGHRRRPSWLSLDGQRQTHLVTADLCGGHLPCVVEAHYANEPDEATPADRCTLLTPDGVNSLYLRAGDYRVRAWSSDGRTLNTRTIHIKASPA